jgi:hypothetical protein
VFNAVLVYSTPEKIVGSRFIITRTLTCYPQCMLLHGDPSASTMLCSLSLQVAAPPAAAAAPPAGVPPEWAATRKQYGVEQGQLGVRTAEFHGLSPFAVFVHPSPALKLQQLWDDGNELVSAVYYLQ